MTHVHKAIHIISIDRALYEGKFKLETRVT